jgi:hypothetical protein
MIANNRSMALLVDEGKRLLDVAAASTKDVSPKDNDSIVVDMNTKTPAKVLPHRHGI